MERGDIEQVLACAVRRRLWLHASIASASLFLSIGATLAVRFELSGAALEGAFGVLVAVGELVFITAIIPLVVTVMVYGASAFSLYLVARRIPRIEIPEAKLRRLW